MDPVSRGLYVAGIVDHRTTTAYIKREVDEAVHIDRCITNKKLSPTQLGDNVLSFAKDNPDYQSKPMSFVVGVYIGITCGQAAPGEASIPYHQK